MFENPEIKLLEGFCGLRFGASQAEARAVFGSPEEEQVLTDELLGNNALVLHYWQKGYSLFFDRNRNEAFYSVEIDNKDALLFGMKLFSLAEKDLVALMKQNGYDQTDSEVHAWGEKRISFDAAGFDCYFENGKMVSANFGVETGIDFSFYAN